jgi:hypothetical protein
LLHCDVSFRQRSPRKIFFPGGIAVRGLSGFEPEPFGLATEVTANYTIPGTMFFATNPGDEKVYAGPAAEDL